MFEQSQFDDIAPELKNHNRDHLVFEPNAGYADPLKTCIDFADQAKANDCSIIEGAEVTAIEPQQDAILVTTEYEQYFCRQLVIAGGAWSPKLLALFGESSKVRSKKIQADFFRHDPKDFTQPSLLDQKQDVFTRPISEEVRLIGTKTDVFDVEPDLPQQACAIQSNTCLTRVKALIGEVTLNKCGGRVGFDGYSPSGKGQIKRAEVDNRIVICDGYSGSGFQFAPAIGRQVALLLNSAL
jgi:glycine/D-amino acid oxidase-like deaminating enzyme